MTNQTLTKKIPMGKINISHNYFTAGELTALDCRLKEYRVRRVSIANTDSGYTTQIYAVWSRADLKELIDQMLNNILTTYIRVDDSIGNWSTYEFQWTPNAYALQQEVLDLLKANGADDIKPSPVVKDVERAAMSDYWRQADYNRKLTKAMKTLEQDPAGAIEFTVQKTKFTVLLTPNGFVIKRNGKFFKKIFDTQVLTGERQYVTIDETERR